MGMVMVMASFYLFTKLGHSLYIAISSDSCKPLTTKLKPALIGKY